ncbi:radical SAM protein [Selenomonas ruminantium]|uniref:radical SAM protein n=1 Tax=Selenomonas ruminantium TaxID=971 RepID=UPI0026F06F94|nr:radical SAM protein [Selenomonas ruminantium]
MNEKIAYEFIGDDDIFLLKTNMGDLYYNDYNNLISTVKEKVVTNGEKEKKSENDSARIKIITTNRCNLHCEYCFSKHDRKSEDLDFEKIKPFLIKFAENNLSHLNISFVGGGEPSLNLDCIKKCVDFTKGRSNITFDILSNGLLSTEVVSYFLNNNFSFMISLDGDYDIVNGQQKCNLTHESFEKIIDNIKYIQQRAKLYITSVITKKTLEEYKNDTKLLIEKTLGYFSELGIQNINSTFDTDIFYQNLSDPIIKSMVDYGIQTVKWKENNSQSYLVNYQLYAKADSYDPLAQCADLIRFPTRNVTIMPDGTYSFCHIEQDKAFKCQYDDFQNGTNPFKQNDIINDIMKQVRKQRKICHGCIARQTCMRNVCPVTIFQAKKKNFEKYCENNIIFRLGMLKRLINHVAE